MRILITGGKGMLGRKLCRVHARLELAIADLPKTDNRGAFLEPCKAYDFDAAGIPGPFRQDNQSVSLKGVFRGLHFQKTPHAQTRLIQVSDGTICDMVVNLRLDSPDFARWPGSVALSR